jgi:hypothetical protein
MVTKLLHESGLRPAPMHAAALGSIALCLNLWVRAKTVDQDERGNAMFWLIGDALEREEQAGRRVRRRLGR